MMIRYLVLMALVALFSSCKLRSPDFAVVNDFLEYEMTGKTYDTIFVIKRKAENEYTIQLYDWGYKGRFTYDPNFGSVWVEPLLSDWPFDQKEIDRLKAGLPNESPEVWRKEDFTNKDFLFVNKEELRTKEFINRHISGKNHVFLISKPMFDRTGNYAIFYYAPTSTGIGPVYPYVNHGMKLMKKEGKKWKFVTNIIEQAYN